MRCGSVGVRGSNGVVGLGDINVMVYECGVKGCRGPKVQVPRGVRV